MLNFDFNKLSSSTELSGFFANYIAELRNNNFEVETRLFLYVFSSELGIFIEDPLVFYTDCVFDFKHIEDIYNKLKIHSDTFGGKFSLYFHESDNFKIDLDDLDSESKSDSDN